MVDSVVGEIRPFCGDYAPENWVICDGRLLAVNQYQALFSLIGFVYGGDGRSLFKVPDLRGRLVVGQGQGANLSPRPLGQAGGQSQVQLQVGQIPIHRHLVHVSGVPGQTDMPTGNVALAVAQPRPDGTFRAYADPNETGVVRQDFDPQTIGLSAGGSQPHDNVMPYQAVNFIIATQGLYPSRN